MKKLFIFALFVFLPGYVLAAQNQNQQASCTICNNQENGQETETRNQTQNQGEETQIQERERIETEIQENKPSYFPEGATSRTRTEAVGETTENLIRLSYHLEDENLGEEIRTIAKGQAQSMDRTNQALDTAGKRSGFVRFLIGANFNQLKTAKEEMEQNRLRIQELNRIMAQISNEGDAAELQSQITTLERQNTVLADQLDDYLSGFSLLGWLFKWLNDYNS